MPVPFSHSYKIVRVDYDPKDPKNFDRFVSDTRTIYWDPKHGITVPGDTWQCPATALGHEADHANAYDKDPTAYNKRVNSTRKDDYDNDEEYRVIHDDETPSAKAKGEGTRSDHRGDPYPTRGPTNYNKGGTLWWQ